MNLFRILITFALLLAFSWNVQAQTATVTWGNVHQTIDGFGASDATGLPTYPTPLTSDQAAFFFGTGPGDLGLSLLRTQVPDDGSCTSVSAACAGGNLTDMQNALANNSQVRIWSSPWSPPAEYKTNGSTTCNTGSGNASLATNDYAAYATYLANYATSLSNLFSINVYAISVQNEPDYCPTTYDGAVWTAANFDTFLKTNLGPTFKAQGLSTLIVMPEVSGFHNLASYANTAMADSAAAAFVGIVAFHDYDADWNPPNSVTNPYASQGKKYWETEASAGSGFGPSLNGGAWDPSMADGLVWAAIIDNRMAVANANAWNWWLMVASNLTESTADNETLMGPSNVIAKRAYVLGNYSKFVRPGYSRVDASHAPQSGVTVSAYKDQSGATLVIIATNHNSSSVSQNFALSGVTVPSMTPWVTSASLNLAQQSDISVSGDAFSYTLPAGSVTTFVGVVGAAAPAAPNPPTDLKAAVQ
jgi:glucuronoarabinoxylan endo-1,4-beta-xylanase